MPIILVADDSKTDRKLVEGLLKPKLDWIVEFAEDGAQAYQLIGEIFPDVVVTDLQMPNMDGIELCRQSAIEHPNVPIILVTGKGSEALAVKALNAGAVSYVPKSALAGSLLGTVEQVLAISKRTRSQDRLMQFTTHTRYQFSLENDQTLIAPMIDFVCSSMEALKLGDKSAQRHVSIAVEEAMINAIFHGNMELDGLTVQEARRALHDGEICDAVLERQKESPYKDRRIRMGVEFTRSKVEVIVRDDGQGFDSASKMPNANDTSRLSGAGGRGLTLIGSFMNDLKFNEDGNEIHMVLRLRSPKEAT